MWLGGISNSSQTFSVSSIVISHLSCLWIFVLELYISDHIISLVIKLKHSGLGYYHILHVISISTVPRRSRKHLRTLARFSTLSLLLLLCIYGDINSGRALWVVWHSRPRQHCSATACILQLVENLKICNEIALIYLTRAEALSGSSLSCSVLSKACVKCSSFSCKKAFSSTFSNFSSWLATSWVSICMLDMTSHVTSYNSDMLSSMG